MKKLIKSHVDIAPISITERFAIYKDDKIISSLYIEDKKDSKPVCLFKLETNKECRRQGYATELVNSAIKRYQDRGIILEVCSQKDGPSIASLIKIYNKLGFKRKGKTKTMYIDPPRVWEK